MEILVTVLISLACMAVGFAIAFFMQKSKIAEVKQKMDEKNNANLVLTATSQKELEGAKCRIEDLENSIANIQQENDEDREKLLELHKSELKDLEAKLKEAKAADEETIQTRHNAEINRIREDNKVQIEDMKSGFEKSISAIKEEQRQAREDLEKQWQDKTDKLRTEFENLSNKHLKEQREGMSTANAECLNQLLDPLKTKITEFAEAFSANKEAQVSMKVSLEEQLKNMLNQTNTLSEETKQLSTALRANPKKQGNWGEEILSNILQASGLTEGVDYITQARENDGADIPDVEIKLPGKQPGEKSSIIIVDAKTSLTDYVNYVSEEDPIAKEKYLKAHVASVKAHVDELSSKNYAQKLKNVAGYVMMFIPNEGAYLTTVEKDPNLVTEAYKKKIIILNASNLMCALSLVSALWRSQKQTENVSKIIESANKVYEKMVNFCDDFVGIEKSLSQLTSNYESAKKRLVSSKGNVISQLENWKKQGITSTKQISEKLKPSDDDDDEEVVAIEA